MVKITLNLDKAVTHYRYCPNHGRLKLHKNWNKCPKCFAKLIYTSQHVWRLVDALRNELERRGVEYLLVEEVPVETKWDFAFHADCAISFVGSDVGFLVDLEPQKKDGRYKTKRKVIVELEEHDVFYKPVTRAECQKQNVSRTARRLVDDLIDRAYSDDEEEWDDDGTELFDWED